MSLRQAFHVGALNAHYAGAYGERDMLWRRLGAKDKSKNLKTLLGERAGEVRSVLEVGCGTGAVLNEVARLGIGESHVGMDLEDPGEHAEAAAHQALTLAQYDGKTIPAADRSFDLVFASHVLEHVPDERGFLNELRRVARKYVYVEVPCELHLRTTHALMQRSLNIGHINAYTPKSFALTLQTSGLQIIDIRLFDHDLDVYKFKTTEVRAYTAAVVRRMALGLSEHVASQLFTYHCGALCARVFNNDGDAVDTRR